MEKYQFSKLTPQKNIFFDDFKTSTFPYGYMIHHFHMPIHSVFDVLSHPKKKHNHIHAKINTTKVPFL